MYIFQNEREPAEPELAPRNIAHCAECGKAHCYDCCKPLPVVEEPPVDDDATIYSRVFGRPEGGKAAPIDDAVVLTKRRRK